jgi:hypothetical protein
MPKPLCSPSFLQWRSGEALATMLKLERNQMKKESRMTTNAAAWSDDDEDGGKTPQRC